MTEPTDHREALCQWLSANGIDPDHVPVDADITITVVDSDVRWLRCEVFVTDANGRPLLNERRTELARDTVTVPLVAEPPNWWQPYTKPTREQLLAAVRAVLQLHIRNPNCGDCEHCSERDYPNYAVPWPCPTIKALGAIPLDVADQASGAKRITFDDLVAGRASINQYRRQEGITTPMPPYSDGEADA